MPCCLALTRHYVFYWQSEFESDVSRKDALKTIVAAVMTAAALPTGAEATNTVNEVGYVPLTGSFRSKLDFLGLPTLTGNGVLKLASTGGREIFKINGKTKLFGKYTLTFTFRTDTLVMFEFSNEFGAGSKMYNVITNTESELKLVEAADKKLTILFTNNPNPKKENLIVIDFAGIPLPKVDVDAKVRLIFK
jgi:hypothetical protein